MKLVFLAQGKQYRVNGFAGCNRYMGTYRIEGGRLRIDAPAATRMACPTPERAGLEADYLRGLGSIDTFTLDNGGAPRHLTFNLRGGDVLEFVRREDPPTPERPGDQAFQSVFRRRGVRAPCLQCRAAGTGASRRFREIFHVHILQLALARSLRARRRSCRLRIAAARPGAQDPRFQPAAASDVYAQTSWDLARWTRPGGALRQIPHPSQTSRPVTISFIHDQGAPVVSGFGGCNQYNAPYTVANGLLIVRSRPVSTMMACNPEAMRLEQDFLDGLTRITSSTLDNTGNPRRLTLLLSSGDTLDFGRRIDPATGGQMGPKKLVYVDSERVPCNAGAGRAMCYQVRDSAAQPWQLWYGDITGFNFQPGVRYRLRVVEVRDPNPPADASGLKWVLDAVVEQEPVRR